MNNAVESRSQVREDYHELDKPGRTDEARALLAIAAAINRIAPRSADPLPELLQLRTDLGRLINAAEDYMNDPGNFPADTLQTLINEIKPTIQ